MRILMATTSFPRWEGDHAGHFVASLAEEIVALGHQVTVIAPHEDKLPALEVVRGVRVRRFRYLPGWAERVAYGNGIVENLRHNPLAWLGLTPFVVAMRSTLRRHAHEFDVIHVHWAPTAALAAPWRSSVPYVMTLHGSDVTLARSGGLWRRLLGRALDDAAGVDVVADAQEQYLLGEGLWGSDRPIAVIPAGVSLELFERSRPPRLAGRFRFLFAGRLVQSKGVLDLIGAFASVRARGVDAELVLIGAGPLETVIRDGIGAAGIESDVTLSGALSHEDALDAIASADALVLPSYGEGSPLVIVEALALGTPVIGSRVGAIPELVVEEQLLIEPGDTRALSASMELLATDEALWRRLSEDGRRRTRHSHAWPEIASATVDLYERSLAHVGSTSTRVGGRK